MARTKVNLDKRNLETLVRVFPDRVNDGLGKMAQDTEGYAKNNMSTQSPSTPGDPPAVVTGNLKNSIVAEQLKFLLWAVTVYALYGVPLEFGAPKNNLAARPFLKPAAKKAERDAPTVFKDVFEVR